MILTKSIRAMVAHLQAQDIVEDENVLAGQSSEEKDGTRTITVEAEGDAQEEPKDSGNYFHDLKVTLKSVGVQDSDGTEPETAHEEKLEELEAVLKDSALAASLTAATSDYHCFDATESGRSQNVEGDVFTNEFTLRLYACPSEIT